MPRHWERAVPGVSRAPRRGHAAGGALSLLVGLEGGMEGTSQRRCR